MQSQPVAKVTLGGNRTLGDIRVVLQVHSLLIIQDGTGSRTVTFNANTVEFKDDTAITLTTIKGDLFVFEYNGSKWLSKEGI